LKKILILALILPFRPLAQAQQGQTFTWSSTKCSDGTAIAWPGCQSVVVPSGSYYSQGVSGLFAEELDGRNANVGVTVTKINSNFIVHVGFQATKEGSLTVRPQDAVWIESNSSIHTTIGATPYPDPEIRARKDADVMKQRFGSKAPITISGPQWTFGYLFFPYDNGASRITIVVQAGNETFRFPFAKNPNANEWLDPDKVPIASPSAAPASAQASAPAPNTMPVPTAPCAVLRPSEAPLAVISFAIADRGAVHSGAMGWTRNWVDKNGKKFPEALFQDCPVQGAKNYLIVFSASRTVLNGFEPVVRTSTSTSTSPVSGSGTLTDSYGFTWSFTYNGDVTTTTTTTTQENVPYTIQSNTLYATAYDEHGVMVSQRWQVYSTKQGGDAANSLGYNLGSALFAINSRGRLLNAVVRDIVGNKKSQK
jgi:hypothetical protein